MHQQNTTLYRFYNANSSIIIAFDGNMGNYLHAQSLDRSISATGRQPRIFCEAVCIRQKLQLVIEALCWDLAYTPLFILLYIHFVQHKIFRNTFFDPPQMIVIWCTWMRFFFQYLRCLRGKSKNLVFFWVQGKKLCGALRLLRLALTSLNSSAEFNLGTRRTGPKLLI